MYLWVSKVRSSINFSRTPIYLSLCSTVFIASLVEFPEFILLFFTNQWSVFPTFRQSLLSFGVKKYHGFKILLLVPTHVRLTSAIFHLDIFVFLTCTIMIKQLLYKGLTKTCNFKVISSFH